MLEFYRKRSWDETTQNEMAGSREKRRLRRHRPGEKALQEIQKYQKSVATVLPREPFKRLVREVISEVSLMKAPRLEAEAYNALLEGSEAFLSTFFDAANRCAIHAGRLTVMPSDFVLLRWILNVFGVTIV